ncbi:MAG: hypothetical protein FWF15_00190, partial [Oscillospiraceae bacterium]|nr:hypothetical protein [Oscillospiraceae bacterium]
MYKIDNNEMLKFFQSNNEIRFYYTCCNSVNAGKKGYGIKKVEFYTPEESKPSLEYVEFIENLFDELVVYINTSSDNFIEKTCKKIIEIYKSYKVIRISTPNIHLMKNNTILKYFNISDINTIEYGVFALLSEQNLPKLVIPDGVEIVLASSEDEKKLKNLDNTEWDRLPANLMYKEDSDF